MHGCITKLTLLSTGALLKRYPHVW